MTPDGNGKSAPSQTEVWNKHYAGHAGDGVLDQEELWIERHLHFFDQKKAERVLDLGCGRGMLSAYLHLRGHRVEAADFSREALELLRSEKPDIPRACFDMSAGLPYADESFGVVLSGLSTHYFPRDRTLALYADIRRVLLPGGCFVLRVNSLTEFQKRNETSSFEEIEQDFYRCGDGGNRRYFSVDSLKEYLVGFAVLHCEEVATPYHGKIKYCIEAVAQKETAAPR